MTTNAGPAYSVVKLGHVFGSCINASGQVAFNTGNGIGATAYFYNGAQFQNLGTLGGAGASANGINDYGQVVGISNLAGRGSSTLLPKMPMRGTPGFSLGSTCLPMQSSLSNRKGALAGNSITVDSIGDGPSSVFLWTPTKGMVNLGTLNGGYPWPFGINNAGEVIGMSFTLGSNSTQGFYASVASGMIDMGAASGVTATPVDINNSGQVAGGAATASGLSYAFLWTKAGGMVSLGGLGSDTNSMATAINNKGQVVGASINANGVAHWFSWTAVGGMIDLGAAMAYPFPFLPAVNDLGQVMLPPSSIWTSAGGKVDIGSLGGGNTTAAAINNLGQVFGSTNDEFGRTRAFVWTSAGGMVDLNTPGMPVDTPLQNAITIADNGSILATSSGGVTYLLAPNARRITWPQSESFLQRSPFQRPAPGNLVFP